MLVVNKRYRGRFNAKATELVKAGTRVGMMWVSGEDDLHCHVCHKEFSCPELDPVHKDIFTECPHCKTPFVLALVTHKGG